MSEVKKSKKEKQSWAYSINVRNCTYYIDEYKRTVVCSIKTEEYGDVKGKATCSERDNFDVEVGKKLALLHAREKLKQHMIEDEFEKFEFFMMFADKHAQRVIDLQDEINNIRKDIAELSGVKYDESTENAEVNGLRYKYDRMPKDEKNEYKEKLKAKREEKKNIFRKQAGVDTKEIPTLGVKSTQPRDEHGRFIHAEKIPNKKEESVHEKTDSASNDWGFKSVLIEME